MNTTPYWMDSARVPEYPALQRDLEVDVLIIGGGLTGLTAAYLLKQAGATVAVLERDRVASHDTGHTTAHLTHVTDQRLRELVKRFGRDHAQAVWDAGQAAIERIHETVEKEGIECEFASVPGFLHAPPSHVSADEVENLKDDAKLAAEMGFEAAYLDAVPFFGVPGIRFANQAKFHPRQYVAGLLKALAGGGCEIFEQSDAQQAEDDPCRFTANGHTVRGRFVIIATHVPLQGARGMLSAALFQTKLAPYTTYTIGAKISPGRVPEASFWDTADPYDYLRIDRHEQYDYAIFGGSDHKTGQGGDPRESYVQLEERLRRWLPEAEVDHRWSGQVVETNDGLPFIGEAAPRQFIGTGFCGNGMTFGTISAMMACDMVTGRKNPWQNLFDPNRKMFPGGAWDYLKENKDYPFYLLKGHLAAAGSVEEIKAGEGKIVKVDGAKVAAYRADDGTLSLHSAICPHMGCVVRWNGAEKTWDCPCHGSRFAAAGAVIAGPAESALAPLTSE